MGKDTRSKLLREVGRAIPKPGAVEERDEIRPRTVTMSERQWLALQEDRLGAETQPAGKRERLRDDTRGHRSLSGEAATVQEGRRNPTRPTPDTLNPTSPSRPSAPERSRNASSRLPSAWRKPRRPAIEIGLHQRKGDILSKAEVETEWDAPGLQGRAVHPNAVIRLTHVVTV